MTGKEVFPTLVSWTTVGKKAFAEADESRQIFDVKFYPYATSNNEQIFAAAFICRPKLAADQPFEVLRWFKDEDSQNVSYNSCVWMKDPENDKPLLCIAGSEPRHLKFIDVESGKVSRTLAGHGRGINDLAISPLAPNLLTSAAEDYTIRIWNTEPEYAHQPCVALFGGEGHREPILAIHYHPNGLWLLSGGMDTAVCLWAVPSPQQLERKAESREDHKPEVIYYPHFFSREVHPDYVDCLAFYGDLIISRASAENQSEENEILIWKIDGFNSSDPPPYEPPIPTLGDRTRSSFPHDAKFRGFQRLLTLDMPHTDRFYRRFSLFNFPGARPILAMGDHRSNFHFWDLRLLEEGVATKAKVKSTNKAEKGRKGKSKALATPANLLAAQSPVGSIGTEESNDTSSAQSQDRSYPMDDRFAPLEAHCIRRVKGSTTHHCSTIASSWSADGTWLVAVGDLGAICIFHRDASVVWEAAGVD